jgi:lycopene beta-cyclase
MTYLQFLAVFLVIPLLAMVVVARHTITRSLCYTLIGISVIAVAYTGPWDNAIIINGVWSYGPHQVIGALVGHVPLEEYGFYLLQVALTGLFCWYLLRRGEGT